MEARDTSYASRLFHHLPYRESSLISLAPVPPSHAQVAPLMDKRVEIHGTSRADMNGKRGVATDFHTIDGDTPKDRRYTVQLDSGEAFKLKRANVRAEGTGGGGGAGNEKSKARYTVQLDSGEAFKLKLANVRAEGTAASASVSAGGGTEKGKAKGTKGKKGRGGRS